MSQATAALARGACPGIAAPMQTGDGLLARLLSAAPLPIARWHALCEAAAACGNGIIEVTQRGNLQFRGLTPDSVAGFAQRIAALGLDSDEHPAILSAPLLGLDLNEHPRLCELAAALRHQLPAAVALRPVGPKVSLIVDGGGAMHLDAMSADVRLQLRGDAGLAHLALGGDAASAVSVGWIEPGQAIDAIIAAFATISTAGISARARDVANPAGLLALRSQLPGLLTHLPPPPPRPPAEPIGMHALNNGHLALGVAPAFGHSDAGVLAQFADAAMHCGAHAIRPAPGRALLAIGLDRDGAAALKARAAAMDFIVEPGDPRRFVFACAGAPSCRSATLDTRRLAPQFARAAAHRLHCSMILHVSGCPKGCAHPGPAALTLVGPDHLVLDGRAGDAANAQASADELLHALQALGSDQGFDALPAHISRHRAGHA